MEFSELVRRRYSVRSYHRRPIPEEVLQRVLDAFVIAPTAANRQPIGVVVLETAGRSQALRRVFNAEWFAEQAPIVLCVCALPAEGYRRKDGKSFVHVDATIAIGDFVDPSLNFLAVDYVDAMEAVSVAEVCQQRLSGRLVDIAKGATTAHVKLDLGGTTVTASITSSASSTTRSSILASTTSWRLGPGSAAGCAGPCTPWNTRRCRSSGSAIS